MLILSRVCAEFTDRNGAVIHRITPAMTGLFHDAPDAIRDNLLFKLLVADGSVKTPEDAKKDRNLEQDPMAGAMADGRDAAIAGGDHQGVMWSEAPGERASGSFSAEDGRQPRATSRNERVVRGTVATIEAADKEKAPEKEPKPEAAVKGTKAAKAKADEKPAEAEEKK